MALLTNIDQQRAMLERAKTYFSKSDGSTATALTPSTISASFGDSAGSHNAFYRGKYLGSTLTDEQSAAIRAGTFDDLYVGDYWTNSGLAPVAEEVNWRIAHFNYFDNYGDTSCTMPHVVVVPDIGISYGTSSISLATADGYVGSELYTAGVAMAKTVVTSVFGEDHILTHREYLTNAVTNGYPSAGAWYDSTVELMNEIMVYGCHVHAPMGNGSTIPNKYTIGNSQFALFRLCKRFINYQRLGYWLRDVVSPGYFAYVDSSGAASYSTAAGASIDIRPAVAIY